MQVTNLKTEKYEIINRWGNNIWNQIISNDINKIKQTLLTKIEWNEELKTKGLA